MSKNNSNLNNILGARIKEERLINKLTQSELAEKVGKCDKTYISHIENGCGASIYAIEDFAKVLNVNPAYLVGWIDEK